MSVRCHISVRITIKAHLGKEFLIVLFYGILDERKIAASFETLIT
jgi:hypothetical protein